MTSLSVSKLKKYRQKLESEGFIQCNKDKGSYKYQIKTLPSGTDKITLRDKAINPKDTVYQGAKETISAYSYILSNIKMHSLTPRFVSKNESKVLLGMESEKFRQKVIKDEIH